MEKPWLSQYPEGVPAEIDLSAFSSVLDVFKNSCKKWPDRLAFTCMGKSLTYAQLDARTRDFAAWLQSKGLERGDRLALMMPNVLQYPVALFGAMRAGLTIVNTNPLYTPRELKHQLNDAGAKAIVVLENQAHVLSKVIDEVPLEHVITTEVGDLMGFPKKQIVNFVVRHVKKGIPDFSLRDTTPFNAVLSAGSGMQLDEPELELGDIAFLQYTGGTTGVAKGAMLTHKNIVANLLQSKLWMSAAGIGKDVEIIITALPLYHIFALTANCLVFMSLGGTNVLITDPRNMKGFVEELDKTPFTVITGVNTLFNGLLNTEGFADIDFSTVKGTLGGGMAVQKAVAEQWKEVTGVTLVEAYGLTETSPAACINPMDMEEYNGCIGLPIPSTECAVMGDDGNFVAQGETGELCVRGPQVMKGYWQRPEATAEVITDEGWLRTGDMAMMTPDGYFKIVDRKKDMILVSGFNVYPNEIEDVFAAHEKVLEVAAIGIPHERSGEVVKICVVKSDESLTEQELRDYGRENLTGYKCPKVIEFFDELPKTNVGKILRRELREAAQAD